MNDKDGNYTIYNEKIFFRWSFFLYSSYSISEWPRLVWIAVLCAQTRVAIECILERMAQSAARFERPAQQSTKPRVKRETRSVLCYYSLVVERESRHCSGEFEQLLLTCIEGCDLQSNTNKFKVRAAAAGMRSVPYMQLGRWYCLDFLWVCELWYYQ